MTNDYTVLVEHKNKTMNTVSRRMYDFDEWTKFIALELKTLIMDVENVICSTTKCEKENWTIEEKEMFNKIRHKLLDCANGVDRLPDSLHYKGVPCSGMNASEFIASLINQEN